MKYIFIFLISIYQLVISPFLKTILGQKSLCRFSPSCSEYARQAINNYGIIRGSYMAMKRLVQCQPFSKNDKYLISNT